MRRMILCVWMVVLAPIWAGSQDFSSLRLEEQMLVSYDVSYNVRFDRGRLDKFYRGWLTVSGHGSYFGMSPIPDSAVGSTIDENDVIISSDTVMQVWKQLDRDSLVFLDLSLSGRRVAYCDSLHPMSWRLMPEQRTIAGMDCHRAEAWFRGRHYVAWYAPSIPLPHGPWKLGGLPGLVVEAYDEERNLVFRLVSLQAGEMGGGFLSSIPSSELGDYAAYRLYWLESFRRLRRFMAAQSSSGCLSCQTKTQISFHSWERMPE